MIKSIIEHHIEKLEKQSAFWSSEFQNIEKYDKNPEYFVYHTVYVSDLNYVNGLFWKNQKNKYIYPTHYQIKIANDKMRTAMIRLYEDKFVCTEFIVKKSLIASCQISWRGPEQSKYKNVDTDLIFLDNVDVSVFLGKTLVLSGKISKECNCFFVPKYYIGIILRKLDISICNLKHWLLYEPEDYVNNFNNIKSIEKMISRYEKKLQRYL